jgi:hypothetical protein
MLWMPFLVMSARYGTMIPEFPEDHELVAFFEAEPTVLDPRVPWFYNTLTFMTVRDGIEVQCEISPSYCRLRLRLKRAGVDLVNVDVGKIVAFSLESRAGRETLRATFDLGGQEAFVLQLKPHVHVAWSTGT